MIGGAYSLLEHIEENEKPWLIQNLVHDSCILQVPKLQVAEAIQIMDPIFVGTAQKKMEAMGVKFNLPLGIDVEVGIDWGSTEKWNGTVTHAKQMQQEIIDYWEKQ